MGYVSLTSVQSWNSNPLGVYVEEKLKACIQQRKGIIVENPFEIKTF